MRIDTFAWLLLFLAALPSRVFAQSYYLDAADLCWEGTHVGEAMSLPVTVLWVRPTVARISYNGDFISLQADVETQRRSNKLMAGIGKGVVLDATRHWRITSHRETWTRVLHASRTGVTVAFPEGLPVQRGRISTGAMTVNNSSQSYESWLDAERHTKPVVLPEPLSSCTMLRLAPVPGGHISWNAEVNQISRVQRLNNGWVEVDVEVDDFVVTGYVRTDSACAKPSSGWVSGSGGSSCGDSITTGRAVLLDVGTPLFARRRGRIPFAEVRHALKALEGERSSLPDRTGPSAWIVDIHDGNEEDQGRVAHILLNVWVRTPSDQLPDFYPNRRNPGGGYGMCR